MLHIYSLPILFSWHTWRRILQYESVTQTTIMGLNEVEPFSELADLEVVKLVSLFVEPLSCCSTTEVEAIFGRIGVRSFSNEELKRIPRSGAFLAVHS